MRSDRLSATLAALAGVALVVSIGAGWFRFPADAGTVSGFDAAGALWVVAGLGVVAVVLAMVVLWGRPAEGHRRAGLWLLALGVVSLTTTLWVSLAVPVQLEGTLNGRRVVLPVDPERLPAAIVGPVAAAGLTLAGLLLARPWRGLL